MTTDELRQSYLDFFVSKGCVLKPSDVLVPRDDPTVLFTPAGMNQFKREFMGLGDPTFKKAVTCQKCLRTGDIDNVGRTAFHETFFEMLGNFSFGDYFKREAIHWAWEYLTKILKIDPDRLSVTVYLDDDEAFAIWNNEIGLPSSRITRMDEADNFWPASAPSLGPNGVCGPCSEIFFHGNGPKEVEIWNLVFTQFNRVGFRQLEPLPHKNIDTGMGLERAAACLQGVPTVFMTDLFRPIVARVAEVLDQPYQADSPDGVRMRRMADHARALTFCIHENVRPSNEKQGYVLRRLLRRAVLDGYHLGRREPFLYQLPPIVAQQMSGPYPEVVGSVPRIQAVIREEEEDFLRNLEHGMKLLEDTFRKTKAAGSDVLDGSTAFKLHATHGIPIEVVESLAAERELTVDRPGFEAAVEEHARISRGTSEAAAVFEVGPLDELKKAHPQGTRFLGYETTRATGKVIGLIQGPALVDSVAAGTGDHAQAAIVLDQSPFYGESGGQVGDTGRLTGPDGFLFLVTDTQKKNDFLLHLGRVEHGAIVPGATVEAEVDAERREAIRRAHSATHLLHHALHKHLGEHAQQAGSKVEPDRLRFDFANPEAVGRDRLKAIEATVNNLVLGDAPITWTIMPLDQARKLGAMALFGEKYPENVRVVTMGDYSRELCGGTHLDHVSQIGVFAILSEESVAAGTRRITALTGRAALDYLKERDAVLEEIAATLKVPVAQAPARVTALLEEVKTLKKQATQRKSAQTLGSIDSFLNEAVEVDGVQLVARVIDGGTVEEMRQLCDVMRKKAGERLAILLGSVVEGKVNLVAAFTPDLVAQRKANAGQWLKILAPIVGGGGGGKPEMATAGGKLPDKLPEVVRRAPETLRDVLSS